ncbi:helix-turn-helix domain-containing protein [Streptomyces sp. GS7]|uniref:helix-turn-helix domain-containing protein n=1 Tax=Streptomyces sp. GS7 TaxID=2692234 RepID=UPI0013171C80|nr:helix-turn-helix transcriptional regulator [Streptomyces sp. GS7]QHC20907.1 helix-turn-helix domain-containing protein [Streptomyces sp. GS7]
MAEDERLGYLTPLQRFGATVRDVRTGRKITQKHLGTYAGYSEAYVSKVEKGTMKPSQRFAEKCDCVFQTRGMFVRLLGDIERDDNPSWFVPYLEREREASRVLDFSTTSIMGIFQTEEYAHAVFRAGHPRESAEFIHTKVGARLRRRDILTQDNRPLVWVVLHEACLRTVVGGTAVMAAQLDHLVLSAESPSVDFQVVPFSVGAAAAHVPAFTLLTFGEDPSVVYSDDPQGGRLYQQPETVALFSEHYDRLRSHALAPTDSLTFIDKIRKEYLS